MSHRELPLHLGPARDFGGLRGIERSFPISLAIGAHNLARPGF